MRLQGGLQNHPGIGSAVGREGSTNTLVLVQDWAERAPKPPRGWSSGGPKAPVACSRCGEGSREGAGSGPATVRRGIQRDPGDWLRNGPEMGAAVKAQPLAQKRSVESCSKGPGHGPVTVRWGLQRQPSDGPGGSLVEAPRSA